MKKTALLALAIIGSAHAYEARVKKGELNANLDSMLVKANAETGLNFSKSNFMLIEERTLATSKYQFYVQTNSLIPVAKTAVRVWRDLETDQLIYAELHLDEAAKKNEKTLEQKYNKARFSTAAIKSNQLAKAVNQIATEEVALHDTDSRILGMKSKDMWLNGDLVREVEVRGRRGVHVITISLLKNKVIQKSYTEFPQGETVSQNLKAHVYPIYEEVEGTGQRLNYELKELKYLDPEVRVAGSDPLSGLKVRQYPETHYSSILAGTFLGDLHDLWSEVSIREQVEYVTSKLPSRPNTLGDGLLLQGKYATVNLHPMIAEAFEGIELPLNLTTNHMLAWVEKDGAYSAVPVAGFEGKVITSQEELLTRVPERLHDHNAVKYINSGVDEVQVYYAVTTLMDSLVAMGFTDKELSEKPFHAFLYDPDISMRDNAYYYDNTINFTTYSPEAPNYARDNPTIWHELGHAIMERLMGVHLGFGDSKGGYGGLSEGMADFVAQIVVQDQTNGEDFTGKNTFRIINETGFYLTNEFHDEGEAYGGAMNDMMNVVVAKEGRAGLRAFTDLTLEAMRLTRNHPSLTAKTWFEHMIIADELGSSVREAGKYTDIIVNSLVARNFSFSKEFKPASMKITFGGVELTADSTASREKPIALCQEEGIAAYDLKLQLQGGDAEFIEFPAVVKVEYKKGALQGAIKWIGEEHNPQVYTVHSEDEILDIPLKASFECDTVNQPDGSCKDYAYIQVFNSSSSKPVAKKRFYLKLKNKECGE